MPLYTIEEHWPVTHHVTREIEADTPEAAMRELKGLAETHPSWAIDNEAIPDSVGHSTYVVWDAEMSQELLVEETRPEPLTPGIRRARDWRVIIDDTGGLFSGWPSVCSDEEDRSVLHRGGFIQQHWSGPSLDEAKQIAQIVADFMNGDR